MAKLKLANILDDKPIKVTIELPATVFHDLASYAEVLGRTTGQAVSDPAKLIVPMVQRFMVTDRVFAKLRRIVAPQVSAGADGSAKSG
ncbi:DUF2274 domain-containing protein [Telmatospirillum siberiense]|uniref:DUF2274 domain-containing protein n=1 Tax=Telmatospirillum siberiense TaxID=382514 RepID=A0A2N3PRB7_9PROT|nr:DUF2274 domain-containing protein [Telmatospirillum siberiense]PKU22960.1 DUF2274 domain-containing protein [Telmatospirillum siberiense]